MSPTDAGPWGTCPVPMSSAAPSPCPRPSSCGVSRGRQGRVVSTSTPVTPRWSCGSTSRTPTRCPRCGSGVLWSGSAPGSSTASSAYGRASIAPSGGTGRWPRPGWPPCSPRPPRPTGRTPNRRGERSAAAARSERSAVGCGFSAHASAALRGLSAQFPAPLTGARAQPSCRYFPRKYSSGPPSPAGSDAVNTRPITSVWSPAATVCSVRHSRVDSAPPISGAPDSVPRT